MGKARLEVAIHTPVVFAGEEVRGRVVVNIDKRKADLAKKVEMRLLGSETTSEGGARCLTVFETSKVLWRASASRSSVSSVAGCHLNLPFAVPLDLGIPGSFQSKQGSVRYIASITVMMDGTKPLRNTTPFTVLTPLVNLAALAHNKDRHAHACATVSGLKRKGEVNAAFYLRPQPASDALLFVAGRDVVCEVEISNDSNVTLSKVRLQLVRMRRYLDAEPNRNSAGAPLDTRVVAESQSSLKVQAKSSVTNNLSVRIPPSEMSVLGSICRTDYAVHLVVELGWRQGTLPGLAIAIFIAGDKQQPSSRLSEPVQNDVANLVDRMSSVSSLSNRHVAHEEAQEEYDAIHVAQVVSLVDEDVFALPFAEGVGGGGGGGGGGGVSASMGRVSQGSRVSVNSLESDAHQQFDAVPSQLDDSQVCVICEENEISAVFVPCGHLVCCFTCSHNLDKCVYCRQPAQSCRVYHR